MTIHVSEGQNKAIVGIVGKLSYLSFKGPVRPTTHRCQLVETGKEFIECHDQFLSRALGGEAGETLDVCKQNTEGNMKEVERE